ncbi:MAG TPA: potassium transporter Kup [Arenimonas sp.]|uniref:potassium transporter Kup n=1 Tax=Arenimonas sp. TaxID=1872635 RepID=UPI002CF7A23F|nr:potassium transporter Kup [Arenimonas sp.]HMB58140.1 potassium transporter Kup [Arenimonas sp.]
MSHKAHGEGRQRILPLVIGAIGVVFGDIGTSPLYTLKEAFGHQYGLQPNPANVLGVLSLVFWAMLLIVTIKYVMVVMRADNRGEGGILALMAVVQRSLPIASPLAYTVGILGILGTALFFGDAVITPAISVLSAVEGLEVATPKLHQYVVPITLAVLLLLFTVQRKGTERVGRIFGPVMVLWFLCLAVLGVMQILRNPVVLYALNPFYAFEFFLHQGVIAWLALGAVVLAVTGGEALYADMGHFGRFPISRAWLLFVMPALVLNYFGQGALVLADPAALKNPFYGLVPAPLLYPMIILATLATVIASQAVISGAFSLARQAIQLGYLPRFKLIHTSDETIGQVYLPWVNRILMVAVMLLVLSFRSSSNLASAYGVSVTGAMLIDTLLLMILASSRWRWPGWAIALVGVAYLIIDGALFSSNAIKFFHGAWVPVALGMIVFTLMRTWRRGRDLVREQVNRDSLRIEHFVQSVMTDPPVRVTGTAVFMTPSNDYMPPALLHNLKHNKVLHERNVLLSVETLSVPRAEELERVAYTDLGHGFARLTLRYGYMEDPDVPKALKRWAIPGPPFDSMDTTFFASREALTANADQGMALWRDKLFLVMSRNATPATEFFSIPGNRLVELGTQVVI